MAAALGSTEYAFLIILAAEGRELSNSEMDELHGVRLTGPNCDRLNDAGYVSTARKPAPYRHAITKAGLKVLTAGLSLDLDRPGPREKRSPRERALWAALIAQQNDTAVAAPPGDLGDRIRVAYAELAGGPGTWVDLVALRPLLADVSKAELDKALVGLLDAPDVRLEPEPFGHRVGPAERRAAVHVGGEDRHKLAIGLR